MPGTISYTLTEPEVVAVGHARYLQGALSKRSLGYSAVTLVFLWLLIFYLNFVDDESAAAPALAATILCGAALVAISLLVALGYYRAGRYARQTYRQYRPLREEYQVTWSDEGLALRTASVTVAMPWSAYDSWQRNALGYLIYPSEAACYVLPLRSFTDEQWNDLGATLVGNKVRQRGSAAKRDEPVPRPGAKDKAPVRQWWRGPWSRPGGVALLWIVLTIIIIADTVVFPSENFITVSRALFLSGAPILAALLAGWVLRLRASVFGLAAALLAAAIIFETLLFLSEFALAPPLGELFFWFLTTMVVGVVVAALWLRFADRGRPQRVAAIALVLAVVASAAAFSQTDQLFWRASRDVRTLLQLDAGEDAERLANAMPDIPADRLWGAQPGLVARAVDGLTPRIAGRPNVYAIAVAAAGTQQLFAREARLALQVAAARFGGDDRGGVLLSNGVADILRAPLATQGNLAAAASGVGGRIDPAADIAFVYLASHGSPDAELATELPSYDELTPISSTSVDKALVRAGVRRRVIIISACYAGSWIPALANDDTIVIAAARKDRTSFGCDDTRSLTNFGEAFLKGPLARGASLREAFDQARKTVARQEARDHLTPSEPQAYVGSRMQAIWTARGSSRKPGDGSR